MLRARVTRGARQTIKRASILWCRQGETLELESNDRALRGQAELAAGAVARRLIDPA